MFAIFTPDDSVSKVLVPLKDIKRARENKDGITIEFYENSSVTLEGVSFQQFTELLNGEGLCLAIN